MTNTYRRLMAVATGQLGLLSRQQAKDVGYTDDQLRSRVMSGSLLKVGTNMYRLPGADARELPALRALMMDIGGDVYASGHTAAALHGFDGYSLKAPFDVTIMRGRDVKRVGHRVHTTTRLDLIDRCSIGDVRSLSGVRTLLDLARVETVEQLTIAFDSGLRDGKFNESLVHRRIVEMRSSGRFGIPKLLDVIEGVEAIRGGHSWLEREYLRIIDAAGLPLPDTQQVLTRAQDRLVRVDFRFPGTPVVVEVLGYRYHRSTEQLRRDAARMNALIAEGLRPYQFPYEQIVSEPDQVVEETRTALFPNR
ncbi:MAG: hypothetical protein IZT58_00015 [Actinobacteria bacterium]|nr:hypothetical protein [Actinomycetota bacterium]